MLEASNLDTATINDGNISIFQFLTQAHTTSYGVIKSDITEAYGESGLENPVIPSALGTVSGTDFV